MQAMNVVSALEKVSLSAIPDGMDLNIKEDKPQREAIDAEVENITRVTYLSAETGFALLPTLAELMLSISVTMIAVPVDQLTQLGH